MTTYHALAGRVSPANSTMPDKLEPRHFRQSGIIGMDLVETAALSVFLGAKSDQTENIVKIREQMPFRRM